MKMHHTLTCAVALTLSAGLSAHAASIVTNGSFEEASTGSAPTGSFQTLGATSTHILGWTLDSGSMDWINTYWTASDGDLSLDMSGDNAGSIYQDLATVIGQWYRLTFDLAGNPAGGPEVKHMSVDLGVLSEPRSFDVSGHSLSDMGWATQTIDFQAVDTTTRLRFTSTTSGAYGPALDNVSVETLRPTSAPTPGAASAGMMLFSALGGARVLRRRARD